MAFFAGMGSIFSVHSGLFRARMFSCFSGFKNNLMLALQTVYLDVSYNTVTYLFAAKGTVRKLPCLNAIKLADHVYFNLIARNYFYYCFYKDFSSPRYSKVL